ncbi:hypothetical protein NW757_014810 [Fusarium falciforme]|nr:hypothetical protein NW757_014810 [Fusarium falciforme]
MMMPSTSFGALAAFARSSSPTTGMRLVHGGNAYSWITSIRSMWTLSTAEIIFCIGDMNRLLALFFKAASGCVFGRVRRLMQNLVAACLCRSSTVWILASASATAVATVRNAPVIACAPTNWALFSQAASLARRACVQTLEA